MIYERVPMRHVVTLNPSRSEARNLSPDTEVSFLPMEAIGFYGPVDLSRVRPVSEVIAGYTYFSDGDIVFAKVTPCFENGKGAILEGLVNGCGFGTTELTVVRPNHPQDAAYLKYVLNEASFVGYGSGEMLGAGGLKRVPDEYVLSYNIPWPAKSDRVAIAAFLDHETGRIDDLIAEQERLITLLDEKRQAVISHVVTKGLDPNVEMKDIGIEWLGEVPAHWQLKAVKSLARIKGGSTPDATEGHWNGDVVWYSPSDLTGDTSIYASSSARNITAAGAQSCSTNITPAGSVVLSTRAPIGSVKISSVESCTNQGCKTLVPIENSAEYLYYVLLSATKELNLRGRGTTFLEISGDALGSLVIPFPPKEERDLIVETLSHEMGVMRTLQDESRVMRSLLKERRSALISAAVTGKIDVRNHPAAVAALNENKD